MGRGTCGKTIPDDAPIPMCMGHLAAAWEYCGDRVVQRRRETFQDDVNEKTATVVRLFDEAAAEREAAKQELALTSEGVDDANSVVYYVRFSDRIKIGFSRNLGQRLTSIPHDELLTVEPGARAVEARRHRQFAEHRIIGEWFASAPALLEHVESLKARHAERERWRETAADAFALCDQHCQSSTDAEVLAALK